VIKAAVLIPVRDNSGRYFRPADWLTFERRLLDLGGFSILPGHVTGGWQYQGRIYRDRSRQYLVLLQSWFDLGAWLDIVVWARTAFGQAALLIDVAGIPEIVSGGRGASVNRPRQDQ
jgi:hypothetical protein